jgi:hypothetical protein
MEAKDIGGVLAGGLIATELLETLVAKGILTNANARHLLLKVIKAVETASHGQEARVALDALDLILKRFPEHE